MSTWNGPPQQGQSPYQDIIDETLKEIECREIFHEWNSNMFTMFEDGHVEDSRLVEAREVLAEVRYSAFCLQWVAVAWCMCIGKEGP